VSDRRELVRHAHDRGVAKTRACWIFHVARSALDYRSRRDARDAALAAWMRRTARRHPDWGYRLAHGHAINRGQAVNVKRFHRVWRQTGLQQPVRTPRRKVVTGERLKPQARWRNHVWCYDFVHDRDAAGRTIRCLTIKDEATAYALAIEPAPRFGAEEVRQVLERLFRRYGFPAYLRSDNGGEFIAHVLKAWLADRRVTTAYIDPGKPWQNGSSESFNSTFRRGCLNRHDFASLAEARGIIEHWRRTYNHVRPHSRLGYRPPASAYFLERHTVV
jgi:putative transposase